MQQFRLIGIVPLGIGLTVIVFLWTASGFGAPPLIFRVFGSFVALGFVITGGAILFGTSMLSGANGGIAQLLKRAQNSAKDLDAPDSAPPQVGYDCSSCGASLDSDADVSPSGDVKCSYCDRWFNIHQS